MATKREFTVRCKYCGKSFNFRAFNELYARYYAASNTFSCSKCAARQNGEAQSSAPAAENEPINSPGTLKSMALLLLAVGIAFLVLAVLEHFNVIQPLGIPLIISGILICVGALIALKIFDNAYERVEQEYNQKKDRGGF